MWSEAPFLKTKVFVKQSLGSVYYTCMQLMSLSAVKVPFQGKAGAGFLNRRGPVGGWAYGMPRKLVKGTPYTLLNVLIDF